MTTLDLIQIPQIASDDIFYDFYFEDWLYCIDIMPNTYRILITPINGNWSKYGIANKSWIVIDEIDK